MSISTVVTRGYGAFGNVNLLPTWGYYIAHPRFIGKLCRAGENSYTLGSVGEKSYAAHASSERSYNGGSVAELDGC